MYLHKWSQEDLDLLRENVVRYGWTVGCKTTANKIGITYSSYTNMCYKHKFTTTSTEPLRSRVFKERKTRHKITIDEEIQIAEYLKKEISKNPHNLKDVFRKYANEFDTCTGTIVHRWYGVKTGRTDYSTKPSCKKNIGITYALVGDNTTINGKNQINPTREKTHWILTLLRKMLNKKNNR